MSYIILSKLPLGTLQKPRAWPPTRSRGEGSPLCYQEETLSRTRLTERLMASWVEKEEEDR